MTTLLNTINEITCKGVQVNRLVKDPEYEMLLVTLQKDAELPPHVADNNAHLVVLEGQLDFYIQEEKLTLEKLQLLNFDKGITHWVKAVDDSKFLIIK